MENSSKKKNGRENVGFISFVLPKETKEQLKEFLSENKSELTRFFLDCIDVSLNNRVMPKEFISIQNKLNSDHSVLNNTDIKDLSKEIKDCKEVISLLNAKVDLLIKTVATK